MRFAVWARHRCPRSSCSAPSRGSDSPSSRGTGWRRAPCASAVNPVEGVRDDRRGPSASWPLTSRTLNQASAVAIRRDALAGRGGSDRPRLGRCARRGPRRCLFRSGQRAAGAPHAHGGHHRRPAVGDRAHGGLELADHAKESGAGLCGARRLTPHRRPPRSPRFCRVEDRGVSRRGTRPSCQARTLHKPCVPSASGVPHSSPAGDPGGEGPSGQSLRTQPSWRAASRHDCNPKLPH